MIKRIIFDLDDTLFNTSVDAKNAYKKFFEKFNIDINYLDLYDELENLDINKDNSLDKFYEFLKVYLGKKFTIEMFDDFCDIYESEVTFINENTIQILKYLKSKYEIIALSNWYYKNQVGKLKNAKIYEYFDQVYCFDNFGAKPYTETFKKASYPHSCENVAIVGDSFRSDIENPRKLGMKIYWLTEKNDIDAIKSIDELMRKL